MSSRLAKMPAAFAETAIGDEVVVMSLATGDFFSLTGTSAAIWRLIDGSRGRDAIVAALADRYVGSGEDIAAQTDAFIAELAGAGFVDKR